ncbi:MAG: hypothetical protein EOO56_03585 [Hymenobacter sp.]|nr:MAG: hypothetical protein EOO56_03585 [Hymenobacter sp.]
MILGRSNFVYRLNLTSEHVEFAGPPTETGEEEIIARAEGKLPPVFVSKSWLDRLTKSTNMLELSKHQGFASKIKELNAKYRPQPNGRHTGTFTGIVADNPYTALHVDVSIVNNDVLDTAAFKKWRPDYADAEFILEDDGTYICGSEVEKMSKAKFNVVNPDVLVAQYGADALRLYEMFLGPLEQFKPWNTNGISGVATFLKKFWRLFHPEDGPLAVTDEPASPAELKTLHRVIQKVAQDVEKFSFNTSVSTFMIAVNELTALGTHKRAILEPLVLLLSPFAPHLAEELWEELGHAPGSISHAAYPEFREEYLVEANVTYPVAINGKVREQRQFATAATAAEIETAILESDFLSRFGDGKAAKKVVVVPGRMVNVVV